MIDIAKIWGQNGYSPHPKTSVVFVHDHGKKLKLILGRGNNIFS